jgi:hypothetical protein
MFERTQCTHVIRVTVRRICEQIQCTFVDIDKKMQGRQSQEFLLLLLLLLLLIF